MKAFLKYTFILGAAFVVSAGTLVHAAGGSEKAVSQEGKYTSAQAAALKAVTDAVATGDESAVREAVSKQVALYPEITGAIVSAALNVPNTSTFIKKLIVRYAVIAAPGERPSILMAIDGNKSFAEVLTVSLRILVNQTLKEQLDWKVHENYVKPPSVS
jgi:hypothetical protein